MFDDRFRRVLTEREVLFKQGDMGDCAYVVESGLLEVSVTRGGTNDVLARVGPGSLIGEMALLDNSTRMATVTALQPSTLRVLTRNHLSDRLDLADPLLRHILHVVVTRYREVVQRGVAAGALLQPALAAAAEWSGDDQAVAMERLRLEQELELALENGELQLHYQPIMRLEDDTVAGFEALIRWAHPKRGLVMPDAFIPLAEQSSLINRIGHWVIRTATTALAQFETVRPAARVEQPLFMTVNLSGRQFSDAQLIPMLGSSLKSSGIAPGQLLLEITESSLLGQIEAAALLMRQCEMLGVRLSVDDFGTGYSALSYLYRLPVSSVKLARAFIEDLATYPASEKIIGAVARLAKDLSMDTVAEGIETAAQAAAVRTLGVRFGQGYYYARGLPLAEAASFVIHPQRAAKRGPAVLSVVKSADR
jgi:EAL domain-containing protein (putative c-di-GMP-specific phosphodiesterase class I)